MARGAVADPANADAVGALADLLGVLQRSRLLRQEGAQATAMLVHLSKRGPMRSCDLAQAMQLDQSTVSRHLRQLTQARLVERSADPTDGRAHVVSATASGRARAERAIVDRVRDFERVLASWSDVDRDTFARLLGRFSAELENDLLQGVDA